jgi:predicted esterase
MLRWWLLILWGGSLFAQNSGIVQAAAQAYHAQRDTAQLSALQLREADRLDQEAQQQAQAGGYAEALRRYAHAGAILRNVPWTPAIEFASSLEVRVDHFMLEPGKPVTLSLGALYPTATTGSEKLIASVFLAAAGPGGPPERALAQGALLEPMRIPFATRITMPETEAGNYNLEVRLKLPDGSVPADPGAVFTKRLPVHVENLSGAAQKLRVRLARISRSKSPALPSAQYALQFYERVDRGEEGLRRYGRYPFREELKRAGALLDDLEAGRDPFGAKSGDFHRAYRSAVDQTLQPYRLFVPEGYDGSRPAPLLIALHGSGGDENDFFDRYQEAPLKPEAQRVGFIVVCPKGREANSGYRGPAERDVFDVLAEAERDYRIDPARIYVMGHSMGAFAAWRLAVEHPGRFAALGLIAGGGEPKDMAKIRHIPQYVVHGANDHTVPVAQSRAMVEAGRNAGAPIVYVEVPGAGHYEAALGQFKPMLDFFARQAKTTP